MTGSEPFVTVVTSEHLHDDQNRVEDERNFVRAVPF